MFNDWYLDSPFTKMFLIGFICEELDELIDINKNDFSNGVYKVRTKYSDSKFYLNKVDGSFNESLHMLIHRIMYVENKHVIGSNDPDEDLDCYYRMFVDFDLFDEIDENPDSRWWIDKEHEQYEEFDEFLTDVYYECIHHVYVRLIDEGFDIEDDFDGYN